MTAVIKCDDHSGHCSRIEILEESDKKQWEAIEEIKDRPPVWATAIISMLTFLLGASLTYAGLITKLHS